MTRSNIDMTWYTKNALGPLEKIKQLTTWFPPEKTITIKSLADRSGLRETEIHKLIPLMLKHGTIKPLASSKENILTLQLNKN